MKTITLLIFMNITFFNGFYHRDYTEPIILIKCFHKIINRGYFSFVQIEKEKLIQINYSYSIDLKNGKTNVVLIKRDTLDHKHIYRFKAYKTESEWAKEHLDSYREKYFKVLDVNFLNMSNNDKLILLDSLSVLSR